MYPLRIMHKVALKVKIKVKKNTMGHYNLLYSILNSCLCYMMKKEKRLFCDKAVTGIQVSVHSDNCLVIGMKDEECSNHGVKTMARHKCWVQIN